MGDVEDLDAQPLQLDDRVFPPLFQAGNLVLQEVPPLPLRPGEGPTVAVQAVLLPDQAAQLLLGVEQVGDDVPDQGEHLAHGRQVEDDPGAVLGPGGAGRPLRVAFHCVSPLGVGCRGWRPRTLIIGRESRENHSIEFVPSVGCAAAAIGPPGHSPRHCTKPSRA